MDKMFNHRAIQYYGVDISQEMINECMARFHHVPNFHFSIAGIEELPFPDSCFDLVLCLGVMEYVTDSEKAANEISRVLKPGGTVIVSMLNPRSPYRIWQASVYPRIRRFQEIFSEPRLLIQRIKRKIGKLRHSENRLPHTQKAPIPPFGMYSLKRFLELLIPNGLTVQDIVYYDFNLFLKPLDERFPRLSVLINRKLEFLCRSKLKVLGTGFIVKGRKD
jgi:SAM-dependent methyltransferase